MNGNRAALAPHPPSRTWTTKQACQKRMQMRTLQRRCLTLLSELHTGFHISICKEFVTVLYVICPDVVSFSCLISCINFWDSVTLLLKFSLPFILYTDRALLYITKVRCVWRNNDITYLNNSMNTSAFLMTLGF